MNLSATCNLLPDYSQHQAGVPAKVHYPISRQENTAKLSAEADMQRSGRDAGAYKYYVLTDTSEMLYNRRKSMQALFSSTKGAIINLYA